MALNSDLLCLWILCIRDSKSARWGVPLCSTLSRTSDRNTPRLGMVPRLGAGITWRFIHSHAWHIGRKDLKTGNAKHLYVVSPCNLASPQHSCLRVARFLTWQLRAPSTAFQQTSRSITAFYHQGSEVTHYYLHHIILVTRKSQAILLKGRPRAPSSNGGMSKLRAVFSNLSLNHWIIIKGNLLFPEN